MTDSARTVFLSYRREVSWPMAQLVFRELTEHGFDVFMDTASIDAGEFERVILAQIEARTHFLVLLEPRSLDRIGDEGDWLRREITYALAHNCNIVPLTTAGFTLRDRDLPTDIARLAAFNAVTVHPDYVAEALSRLRERFLRPPPVDVSARAVTAMRAAMRAVTLSAQPVRFGVKLSWSTLADAGLFELERSSGPEFDFPIRVYRGVRRGTVDERPGQGSAYYRVRLVVDGVGQPWSEIVHAEFGGVADLPARPALDLPPKLTGRREGDAIRLEWTPVVPAAEYQVALVRLLEWGRPESDAAVTEVYRGAVTSCSLPPAPEPRRVCVRALDRRGNPITDWSDPISMR